METKTTPVHPLLEGAERYVVRYNGKDLPNKLVRYMSRIDNDGLSLVPCNEIPSEGDAEISVVRLSLTYDTWIASDGMSRYIAKLIDNPNPPAESSLAAENALLAEQNERLRAALKPFADFGAAWIRMPAGTMPDDSAVYAIHGSTKYAAEITLGQLKEAHRILTSLTPASK